MNSATLSVDDQIQKVYTDLQAEIDVLVKNFWSKKQAEIEGQAAQAAQSVAAQAMPQPGAPGIPANKSLPWFTNGIRSFLRKLWHGDSKDNPDWHDVPSWKWNTRTEHVSLSEYFIIRDELCEIVAESVLDEKSFIDELMTRIRRAMETVKSIVSSTPVAKTRKPKMGSSIDPANTVPDSTANPLPTDQSNSSPEELSTDKPTPGIAGIDSTATGIPAVGGKARTPKPPVEQSPPLTPEIAKKTGEKLLQINHDSSSVDVDDLPKVQQEINDALQSAGVEFHKNYINIKGEIGRGNIEKLIQIMQQITNIHANYDWTDPDHIISLVNDAFNERNRGEVRAKIQNMITSMSKTGQEAQPEEEKQVAHVIHQYDNIQSIQERTQFLKKTLRNNNYSEVKNILISRRLPKEEKIDFFKSVMVEH